LSHSLQYCGHFIPGGLVPAAFAAFQSAPQARSRAIIAARPPVAGFFSAVAAAGGGAVGFSAAGGGVGAGFSAAGGGVAAGASPPHSALRKSFHFMPLRVPAALAAWYLALHSFAVRAYAGAGIDAVAKTATNIPDAINKTVFMAVISWAKLKGKALAWERLN
jgi:hypothetical protein